MKKGVKYMLQEKSAGFWMLNVVAPIVTIEFQTLESSYTPDTDSKSMKSA